MADALASRSVSTVRLWPDLRWRGDAVSGAALSRLILGIGLLGGFGLRLVLLNRYPLREDEAIYSYWALALWRADPLALHIWPDKPPLFLWLLGGVFQLLGPTEASARLLNVAADTLTIVVVATAARHLWGRRAGLLAGLFYALNPFAISFAPSAYTDPLLVLLGMLAVLSAVRRRPFGAGLFLAAAVMTKQPGVLYAPLVLALLGRQGDRERQKAKGKGQRAKGKLAKLPSRSTHYSLRFALALALVILPILGWDSRRWAVAPSPWDLSVRHYGGLMLLPPEVWLPRLQEWGAQLWYLTASWPLWVLLAWLAVLALLSTTHHAPHTAHHTVHSSQFTAHHLLLLWSLAFLALHVVSSVQVWDRYLLPLAPMLALLGGWAGQRSLRWSCRQPRTARKRDWNPWESARFASSAFYIPLAILLLAPPAWTAAQGGLPVGGDHGDYSGLREAVAWVRQNAPQDAVLYHRVLGWHYRFYFFDGSRANPDGTKYELRWYPHPVYLADNAAKTPYRRKFLIQPDWAPVRGAARRLAQRGVQWRQRFRAGKFTVYELVTPPLPFCDWCACVDRTRTRRSGRVLADVRWGAGPALPRTLSPRHLVTLSP